MTQGSSSRALAPTELGAVALAPTELGAVALAESLRRRLCLSPATTLLRTQTRSVAQFRSELVASFPLVRCHFLPRYERYEFSFHPHISPLFAVSILSSTPHFQYETKTRSVRSVMKTAH